MEKQLADERRRQWLWQTPPDEEGGDDFDSAVCEALCWPCGIYARIQERLRNAIEGRNPVAIEEQPFCNTDCATFCICLPFYSFFIAKLQETVRDFYDIDGSEFGDFTDGLCCPPLTLVRNENEIIYRENQGGVIADPYRSPPPMESSSSSSSSSNLNTIPETSREPSTSGPSRRPPRDRTGLHSIAVDPVYPTEAAASPHVHYLDEDPTMQTKPPVDTSHELRQDPTGRRAPSPARKHSLATDHLAPLPRPALHHEIHHDETAAPPTEPPPHNLEGDMVASFPGRQPVAYNPVTFPSQEHDLHHDPPVPAPQPTGKAPHELHHDEVYSTPAATPAALHGSRVTEAHDLHHDEVHPTPPALRAKQLAPAHTLDDDEMFEVRPARPTYQPPHDHNLHDHF
ncbi:Fc.00g046580.m01.CDS01 [Cosmosporella sp. VM-42]